MQKMSKRNWRFLAAGLALILLLLLPVGFFHSRYIANTSAEIPVEILALRQLEITLSETKVDEYGTPLTGMDAGTTSIGQRYCLVPGKTYVKDPVITVKQGSTPCWLFVRIENDIVPFEAESHTIETQIRNNGWLPLEGVPDVYYYGIIDAFDEEKQIPVFEEFSIDGNANNVTGWDTVSTANTFLLVSAYAIQADNLTDPKKSVEENALNAWNCLFVEM